MSEPGGHWSPRFRVVLIGVILLVGIAVTMVSTLLFTELEKSWTPGSVARAVLGAMLALFSGVYVNLMLAVIVRVWRRPEPTELRLGDAVSNLGTALRQPLRRVGIVLTVVAIVVVGLVLRPPDAGPEPGGLVIMTAFNESANDPRTILFEQWNQANPDNQLEVVPVSGEPDQQNERMVNDAKPGGANRADVYLLDVVWTAQFAELEYIRELDRSAVAGDFVPRILDTCTYEEKLWAVPFNTDVGMLFYRDDLTAAPKNWDDYFGRAAADAARAAGVEAANAASLDDEEILTVVALEAMWAAGGEAFGRDGEVARNADESAVELGPADLTGIERLVAASRDPDIVLDEARTTTDNAAVGAFADGRSLYMRNWPVAYDKLLDRVEFGVVAPPTASVLGGQNLAISASTDKPRAARALIEFLTSASSQLILSELGGFAPTRQSAYDNSKRADIQQIRTALNDARLRPRTPNYVEFSRVFREGIAYALTDPKGQLPPDLLERLAEILDKPVTQPTR
ncbi:multiple sugar transport system substrate-binding protein [Saccharothrix ecbatanensis]|uniref:Multiple sugar transport system substrate-binding protein n=1 Tax=Saccharothrix ecbatanensis TaxID=1105145 RepID=A0A7W9LZ99_9PSEU|nr:extracellular solute-binding protein [Saccharothrix ecbatanensis]MBB5801640.1 multiple sugar transport system substrate-binding protein [Saccharothrix ecbatanensis]